jgi:hypothetical protein
MDAVLGKILKDIESVKNKLGPYTIEYETKTRLNVKASKFVRRREEVLSILSTAFTKSKPSSSFPKDKKGVTSSVGGIIFEQSDYKGYVVQAKDDKAAGGGLSTAEQETLGAYYIAVARKYKKPTFSPDEFKSVEDNIISKFKYKQLEKKVTNDWALSSKRLAKHILKRSGGFLGLPSGMNFTLQHPSAKQGFIDKIYKRFAKLIKETELSFLDRDKWNPGDVWYVDDSVKNTNFDEYTSVIALNKFLVEEYEKGNVIPISLKQLVNDNVDTTVKNYNSEMKKVKFEGFDLGKQSFFKSIDGNLYFNGSVAECRTFTGDKLSAEIKGVGAKGGKVGATIINNYFKKYNSNKNITDYKIIGDMITKKRIPFLKDLYEKAIRVDKRIKGSVTDFMESIDQSKYAPAGSQPEFNYLLSKYQATEMMDAINDLSNKNKDNIVYDMISYASSQTELSSVHIVIRN